MANTCFTDYTFVGEPEKAKKLLADLKRVINTKRKDLGPNTYLSESDWLGWIVRDLLGKDEKADNIHCGGTFYLEDELTNNEVRFTTSTRWTPCREMFKMLAEKYGLDHYYYAEEIGCNLLETNDDQGMYYTNRYMVTGEDIEDQYFATQDEVLAMLKEQLGKEFGSWEEMREDEEGTYEYNVYEIEIV